jgi:PAS domain S-box-containing protein
MSIENKEERYDVNRKTVALISFGVICALLLILIVNVSINTSSGIRAYVAGEGFWTKAQKESVIHLMNFILTEDEKEYEHFNNVLRINRGDRISREEIIKEDFDYQVVYDGYLMGENHPEDIPHMIKTFRRFGWTPQVKEAIKVWTEADLKLEELTQFADSIKTELQSGDVTLETKTSWVTEIEKLDHELTNLEVRFSAAMGNMARLVNTLLRWSVIVLGLLLIAIGFWLTYRFLQSTKAWMRTLKQSEEKFKNVLSNSRDVLYKMDLKSQQYEYVSPSLKQMLGYEAEDFLNGGVNFIVSIMHPDDKTHIEKVIERYRTVNQDNFSPVVEFRVKDKEGQWRWVSNARTLVKDENGEPEAIVGTVRDISDRKKQDQKLKKSLEEKEILLQEIHHRVKNNLAIISSLLELQKDGVPEEVEQMLSSSQSRIKSIAKVHEKLYESTTLSNIPLSKYIEELSEEIQKAYTSKQKNISLEIDVIPLEVNINEAIPIGLILNELINNAFKHAFKNLDSGIIRIMLTQQEDGLELVVENNGNSIPKDFDPSKSDSLGMTLVQVLMQRIDGTLAIESDDWTRFKISFKLD